MHQIARDEEEEALAQASQSTDASSLVESFEGMEPPSSAGGGSTMSSVYGTSDADAASKRSSSRSPSRTGNGSFVGSIGHALLHRRSSSRSSDPKKQQQHDPATTPTPAPAAVASEAEKNTKKRTGRESASAPRSTSGSGEKKQHDSHLARWLHDGNVIYKSVGMGLMDLVVGQQVVSVARRHGFGTEIDNFSSHPAAAHVLSGPPAQVRTEPS